MVVALVAEVAAADDAVVVVVVEITGLGSIGSDVGGSVRLLPQPLHSSIPHKATQIIVFALMAFLHPFRCRTLT